MGAFISWLNKNLPKDPKQGSAQNASSPSLRGMIATLVPVLLISAVYLIIWLVFRRSQYRFYAPRATVGTMRKQNKSPPLPKGWFNWIGPFWKMPDAFALQHNSLDAYLFIRFLRTSALIAFVSLLITWPILFPINATGGAGRKELEILSFSNVSFDKHPNYLYAHVFVGWAVYGFAMYMITRECIFYINLRQTYLLSPFYGNRLSARTVLFTNVPPDYLDEARLRAMFPGTVKNVWIAGDTKELDELVETRDKTAMKLEKAEVKLIKLVNKERSKALKKGAAPAEDGQATRDTETGNVAARWIPDKKRPSHKLGFLGLLGKKVDTIEWGRSELQHGVPKAETAQAEFRSGKYTKLGAVFIEFVTQSDAEVAFQTVTHHQALHMCPKVIGIKPSEVVWKNLGISWWQKVLRRYAVIAFIVVLIIFWAIPVGIVSLIAQVETLENIPGLTFIKDIPSVILGVVSGLLPAVAVSILMSFVPIIMRALGRASGLASLSQIELFTQNAYFCFQVIQVFLVQTLFNAAASVIPGIARDPSSVFSLLSSQLPTAANFYISYFIVQGLTIATSVLTQVVGMFVFRILYKFLAGTPRAMFNKWTSLSALLWGSLLPVYTNIVVISITYSVIAPLCLFWSSIGLFLFYLAYRYNVLFVSETAIDTRGLIYPRALKQLYTGIYLGEICMVGLFAVSKQAGPAVLMAVFLIFTILFHITMNKVLDPLLYGLSRSLAAEEQLHRERAAGTIGGDAEKIAHTRDGAPQIPEIGTTGANGVDASKGADGVEGVDSVDGAKVFNGDSSNGHVASGAGGVEKKGNIITKFLKPWVYADYHTLRKLIPVENVNFENIYTEEDEKAAYWPPSAISQTPTLWIPEDTAGVSRQEVAETSKVIPITDEGATIDEKNKIHWDEENATAPIYTEKPQY